MFCGYWLEDGKFAGTVFSAELIFFEDLVIEKVLPKAERIPLLCLLFARFSLQRGCHSWVLRVPKVIQDRGVRALRLTLVPLQINAIEAKSVPSTNSGNCQSSY